VDKLQERRAALSLHADYDNGQGFAALGDGDAELTLAQESALQRQIANLDGIPPTIPSIFS
jgi:hypothetical protein